MLSPGVEVREIDLSIRVPEVSKAIACFGGIYNKGPVDEKYLITNVDDYISFFGEPSHSSYNDWFQVYNFLQYANKCYVTRAFNEDCYNSHGFVTVRSEENPTITLSSSDKVFIKNGSDFEQMYLSNPPADVLSRVPAYKTNSKLLFVAQTYGAWGDDLSIGIATKTDFVRGATVKGYTFSNLFEYHPGTEVVKTTINPDSTVSELVVTFKGTIPESVGNNIDIEVVNSAKVKSYITGTISDKISVVNDPIIGSGTTLVIDVTSANLSAIPTAVTLIPESKEIGVVVLYKGAIVEKYIVSMEKDAKDYQNKSLYIEEIINRKSNYVYVKVNGSASEYLPHSCNDTVGILNLRNYGQPATEDLTEVVANCYAPSSENGIFSNKEEFEVDIVIANERAQNAAINLANDRQDCIAFLGARESDVVCNKSAIAVNNLVEYVTSGELNVESSYSAFFGNYKYQYDKWNDTYRWVNLAGDVAGLRADVNTRRDVWWASAGIDRGQIKNAIKLAFNPNQGERDVLYKTKINPIVGFPGQGNAIVWGQKTLQSKPSAFDRINVRGLFNTLERAISRMAKYYVFEINDEFTRNRFKATIEPFLRNVKANRGIYDFYVRCDSTNNTPYVIDNNQFIADIAIKPARTAEYLTLNFIAVSTGVEFSEIFA